MTDGRDEEREIERVERLPIEARAEAYLALQRRLQARLERPAGA